MTVSLPPNPLAMGVREGDVVRHLDNRTKYENIYDAWSNESPAHMSSQFSAEVRECFRNAPERKAERVKPYLPTPLAEYLELHHYVCGAA